MDAISISAVSLQNNLQKLDTLSHNVANMSTPGYKRAITSTESFASQLSRLSNTHSSPARLTSAIPSTVNSRDFTAGALNFTDNPLNIAVEGNGFFELVDSTGTYYSKRGDFSLDSNGQVKLSGSNLLLNGVSGDIRLQSAEPEITATGRVFENNQEVAQIKVVTFENTDNLISLGQGVFRASASSSPQEVDAPAIRQSYLEASNSQPAEEMLNLIQLARHMEATQQVIRGYDDMLATVFEDLGRF